MLKFKDTRLVLLSSLIMLSTVALAWMWNSDFAYKIGLLIGLSIIILVLVYLLVNTLIKKWILAAQSLQLLLKDQLSEDNLPYANGGFALLFTYIRQLYFKFKEASELVHQIGDTTENLAMQHLDQHDSLGKAIVEVQEKMKKYKDEESKRNWGIQGMAQFAELLRHQENDLKEYSFKLISAIVKYIHANQGSFFVLQTNEQGEEYLQLTGGYAYDRRKYAKKEIYAGDGLLGQCLLEKDLIYLTDIPANYIEITSGLGHATPTNIIIVPFIVNDQMQGAMELATFNPLQNFEVEFLRSLATSIASSIANTKINARTQKLLEDSQTLTAELQHREEEMRQNMEELSATQEEMQRKQVELDGVFAAINHSLLTAELSMDAQFIDANEALVTLMGHSFESIQGVSHQIFFQKNSEMQGCWTELKRGEAVNLEHEVNTKFGAQFWLSASYTPVADNNGVIYKVLMLAHDITSKKEQEKEFERLSLVADNTDNSVVITNTSGLIEFVNQGFTKMTGYTVNEVLGKKPGSFLQGPETNLETIERISAKLKSVEPIYEEILNYDKFGNTYWVSLAINPVFDKEGNLFKYIAIQANITETKKSALDSKYKLQAISHSNAVIEFDTQGIILDANQNFLEIVGYNLEEIKGQHHQIFCDSPTKNSSEYKAFWERLSKGEFVQGEFTRTGKLGNEIVLRGTYNPIYDINGKPYKIIKFAVDITEEKKLKLATQKHEAELNSHMEAINKTIASVEFELNGVVRDCNEIYCSITGFNKSELIGKHYNSLIPKEEIEKPQNQLMWESLRQGQFFSGEYKQMDKEGHELWLNGTFNAILDEHGKPYKIMLFAQFTTKEKEKQNDLTGTVNALRNIVPIIELNQDGIFKNANELFFNEFGYKRLELRQKSIFELLDQKKHTITIEEFMKRCEGNDFCEEHLTFITNQGEPKLYRTTFTPIRNLEHQIYKIIVILVEKENIQLNKQKMALN